MNDVVNQLVSPIPGFRTLLLGDTGCGKTYSIGTLADMGFKVYALFTEPGMETIGQYYQDRKKPIPDNIHWKYVAPAAPSFAKILDSANKINSMNFEMLAKLSDINKKEFSEFIEIVASLQNFKSDRDGSEHGSADSWDTNTVLFFDSMTGLSLAAMNLVTGSKPVKSMADWGVAISNLEFLITKLTTGLRCHLVMTAHMEREQDEITGGVTLMASTLGKKLAPKIPRFFSDVIHAVREGDKFTWSTNTMNVALKARNLPIKSGLAANFDQIVRSWEANGGIREGYVK